MEMDAILNILFAIVIGGLGWWLKTQREELDRLRILLNLIGWKKRSTG
jgi:hypothetical protein